MAETQGSKRRRTHSSDPHMLVLAIFSHRYISYLLPALLKVGTGECCRGNRDTEIRKIVRFEVDMALVLSASGFSWSRALKQKLEQGMDVKKPQWMPPAQLLTSNLSFTCRRKSAFNMVDILDTLWTVPVLITRPLAPAGMQRAVKQKTAGCTLNPKRRLPSGGGELQCCIRTLRRILPGGDEMGEGELLSEVESYVICLQMQVSILRSLLDAHRQIS